MGDNFVHSRCIAWLQVTVSLIQAYCMARITAIFGGSFMRRCMGLGHSFSGDSIMHLLLLVQFGLVNNIIVRAALL